MKIDSGFGAAHQEVCATEYLRKVARYEAERDAAQARPLCFAYGRLRLVNAVVSYRHGGPCLTDDGVTYLDLMMPYAVEIAHLDRNANFSAAMRRFRWWLPKVVGETGNRGMGEHWDALCELRSVALSLRRSEPSVGNVQWLPTAEKIRDDLMLRRAERDAINALYPDRPPIRGVGVIDPLTDAEKREGDRLRKEASRRAAGVRPQSIRNKTAQREALAAEIGCSAKTLSNHERAGTIESFLSGRGHDFQKVSARYIYLNTLGQILETPDVAADPQSEAMAMLRDILADPYAQAWDDTGVI